MTVWLTKVCTEREPDGVYEDCTWASGVMLANEAYGARHYPQTQAEYEALRAASGDLVTPRNVGSNVNDLMTGFKVRYGWQPRRLDGWASVEAAPVGTAIELAGLYSKLPSRLRRWSAFTGPHAATAVRIEAGWWWLDPLAPRDYAGEAISEAELKAFFTGISGAWAVAVTVGERKVTYSAASPVFGRSLTAAQFGAFLRSKGSPAAAEAPAIFVALGSVDPAVALGQFAAESSFGTAGYARVTRNWGNIIIGRPALPHWTRAFGGTPWKAPNGRTYAKFATWHNGARAYAALLRAYRLRGWAPSIQAMCRRWLGGIGTAYIGNIVRIANQATASAPSPPPAPIPPPEPPRIEIPAIATTPEHLAAIQMTQPIPVTAWTAEWENDPRAWVAGPPTPSATYVLVHGGPIPADDLGGIDRLAGWLAARGARAVAVEYPTLLTYADALAPLRAATAKYRPRAIVAHSLGGYFASLLAYESGLPLVLIAADDQIGDTYRAALGNAPDARAAMRGSRNRVTMVTGSEDPVSTVAEAQSLVNALNATGHPGRWLVIDGADHNSILSDTGAIAAVLG